MSKPIVLRNRVRTTVVLAALSAMGAVALAAGPTPGTSPAPTKETREKMAVLSRYACAAEVADPWSLDPWLLGLDPRGGGRAARHDRLRGEPGGSGGRVAASSIPIERGAGRLPRPACDDNADLRGAAMVVHMPAGAPGRRSATPGSQTLSPTRQQIFWKPRSPWAYLHSCRESGKFRGLFRLLAAEMGTDEAIVRAALNGPTSETPDLRHKLGRAR